jgi:hypothetical protein
VHFCLFACKEKEEPVAIFLLASSGRFRRSLSNSPIVCMIKSSSNFATGIDGNCYPFQKQSLNERVAAPLTTSVRRQQRILLSTDNSKKCFCQQKIPFFPAKNLLAPV